MGDRAFARARAAGKNETEAGHARAKAEADIALSLPAELDNKPVGLNIHTSVRIQGLEK